MNSFKSEPQRTAAKKNHLYDAEETAELQLAVKRMLGYTEEEWDAVTNPELMTRELFTRCLSASSRINDFDTFMKLANTFPDYFDTAFAMMESRLHNSGFQLTELS